MGVRPIDEFAAEVGADDPVAVVGASTHRPPPPGIRHVAAPSGVTRVQPDEMVVECGAGTPVAELDAALFEFGQMVALRPFGTVGGALATASSGLRRLGYGPHRDTLLQARYVNAAGEVVTAGGPTVKNVSGFDLCRLLVGSWGTLGFIGEVILRTRPRAAFEQWYVTDRPPFEVQRVLYRPTALLWDGSLVYALLEGHAGDVEAQAAQLDMTPGEPPELPTGGRWSLPPSRVSDLAGSGRFVAELGVGLVHHEHPAPPRSVDPTIAELHRRIKHQFDPTGRLNPGVDVLAMTG